MKKLRTLRIGFREEIPFHLVPAFRGAVVEKVGREHVLFHQHLSDDRLMYAYPLIQYKSIHRLANIICLGEGVDEIHEFFNKETWEIDIKGRKTVLSIDRLDLNTATLNVWNKDFNYHLSRWLALSEKNYPVFQGLKMEADQINMLEKILTGNILAFAKGIDWHIDQQIKVRIDQVKKTSSQNYKSTRLMGFDIDFSTNVFLPNYIGLGKGVSHGYGVVRSKKESKS